MVFWKRYIDKVKTAISKVDFLKLEKKVKQNESDIAINKELINQAEQNITTLTETVNTNSSDISVIKSKYAKKDETNSWTASQNFDAGGTFREDLNVFGDKKFKFGWDTNDVKLTVESVSGKKDAKISATQASLLITAKNNVEINKLKEPTNNDDAATKKYVDDKVAQVPQPDLTTYLTKQDATNTYLSKVDAQADYARLKDGISNDWYSTQTFNKGTTFKGTSLYIKENILDIREITNKNYVDTEINKAKQYTNEKLISRTIATDASNVYKQEDYTANGVRYLRYNYNYGSGVNNIITIYLAEPSNNNASLSYTIYNSGWIDLNLILPKGISGTFYSQFVIKSWG